MNILLYLDKKCGGCVSLEAACRWFLPGRGMPLVRYKRAGIEMKTPSLIVGDKIWHGRELIAMVLRLPEEALGILWQASGHPWPTHIGTQILGGNDELLQGRRDSA